MIILAYLPDIDKSSAGVLSYIQTYALMMQHKIELHILTAHTDEEQKISVPCTMHYLSSRYMPSYGTKLDFLTILNAIKPDVFHTNVCWIPLSALTAIWAKEAGYKVAYTPHGMMEPWIMKRNYWTKKLPALILYQRRALKAADVLHATSEQEKLNLLRLGYNKNVSVIPNCIDISEIEIKQSWQRSHNVLYLGRIHEKKGIEYLLRAISKHGGMGYHYTIVGDKDVETPEYRDYLIKLSHDKGLDTMVTFRSGVYGSEKYELMREADVVVLPTHSENFGIVVAEALACGTPVITTKGTPWQELETCHCGWWTEIGTEGLTEALKDFASKTEEELEVMGRNGRRLIEEKYSCDKIAEQFVKMYQEL